MPDEEDIRAALRGLTADEPPLGFGSDEVVTSGRRRQYRRGGMVAGVASIATAVAVTVPLMLLSGHDVAGTGSGGPVPAPVPKTAAPRPPLAQTTPPGIFPAPTCGEAPPLPLPTASALPTEMPTVPPAPTESPAAESSLPLESPSVPVRLVPSKLAPSNLPDRATATAEPPRMARPPTALPSITQSPIAPPSIAQTPTARPSDLGGPRPTVSPSNPAPAPTCAPTASR